MQRYQIFVDGKLTEGGGEPLMTINPATGEVLAQVDTASNADVDAAVRAARRAYDKVWSRMPGTQRAKYLVRIARLVQERAGELAVLESQESGTPIRTSRDVDVPGTAAHFFHHAGWADKLGYAGYGPDPRPLGVTGQVVGCDAPLLTAAWTVAPALACGNTVILKPAETTPLTALALAEICQLADLPPGVLNVVPGTGEVGATLIAHDGLGQVTFTGSTEVGKQVQRTLAGTGRRLTLALGRAATTIVFDDAPLGPAVDGIVAGICSRPTGSRLLVSESIAEQLLGKLRVRIAALRVGDPLDQHTDVGAISSGSRLERVRALADGADTDGAQRWTGPGPLPEQGFFFAPTVFSDVSRPMRIAREEIVGPVLPMLTCGTPDEAVATANDAPATRCTTIWTGQGARFRWAAQRIRAGVVWANPVHRVDPAAPVDPSAPVGGCQGSDSGTGRARLVAYLDV